MEKTVVPKGTVSEAHRRELIAEGGQLVSQARAIRALMNELVARAGEHEKRMFRFKQGRDLNRAEAVGDRELGEVLYAVCREGETLRILLERFGCQTRGART